MLHLAHPRAPRVSRVVTGGSPQVTPLGRLEAIPRSTGLQQHTYYARVPLPASLRQCRTPKEVSQVHHCPSLQSHLNRSLMSTLAGKSQRRPTVVGLGIHCCAIYCCASRTTLSPTEPLRAPDADSCPVDWPLHDIVITNVIWCIPCEPDSPSDHLFVWCIPYEQEVVGGRLILSSNRAIVLHQGG